MKKILVLTATILLAQAAAAQRWATNGVTNPDMEGIDFSNYGIQNYREGWSEDSRVSFTDVVVATPGVGVDGSKAIRIESKAQAAEAWSTQLGIIIPKHPSGRFVQTDDVVRISFDVRCEDPTFFSEPEAGLTLKTQTHGVLGEELCSDGFGFFTLIDQEWTHVEEIVYIDEERQLDGTGPGAFVINLGADRANDAIFYFDNVSIEYENPQRWVSLVKNGDFEGEDMSSFSESIAEVGLIKPYAAYDNYRETNVLKVSAPAMINNAEESRLDILLSQPLPAGTEFVVLLDVKASENVNVTVAAHSKDGLSPSGETMGSVSLGPQWDTFCYEGVVDESMSTQEVPFQCFTFYLAQEGKAVTYTLDDVEIIANIYYDPNNYNELPNDNYYDYENAIYCNEQPEMEDDEIKVPFIINHLDEITGYQLDIVLPDGLTVVHDEDGLPKVENSNERTHKLFDCEEREDGSLRVVCGSTRAETFEGEDTPIFNLYLKADRTLASGSHPIMLRNIVMASASGEAIRMEQFKCSLNVKGWECSHVQGDMDGDGNFGVSDLPYLIDLLLKKK